MYVYITDSANSLVSEWTIVWEITISRGEKCRKDILVPTSINVLSIYVISSGGSTVKLMKVKFLGLSLARSPSKTLGWTLNKYWLSYLILYSWFYIFFLTEGPRICISFRLRKIWIRLWSYQMQVTAAFSTGRPCSVLHSVFCVYIYVHMFKILQWKLKIICSRRKSV